MCLSIARASYEAEADDDEFDSVEYYSHGPIHIWTVDNFLPKDYADMLYEGFEMEWLEGADNGWKYTTFVAGKEFKLRSNDNIEERKAIAQDRYNGGLFTYSKHELYLDNPLALWLRDYMNTSQTLIRLSSIVEDRLHAISDSFISCYGEGDFLSRHSDNDLGTYAWVLHLTKNWTYSDGGVLRFYCDGEAMTCEGNDDSCRAQSNRNKNQYICHEIVPSFNSLVLFRTRPVMIRHDVSPVTKAHAKRYAGTGWVRSEQDRLSEVDERGLRRQQGVDVGL
eukprot:gene25958-31348_t